MFHQAIWFNYSAFKLDIVEKRRRILVKKLEKCNLNFQPFRHKAIILKAIFLSSNKPWLKNYISKIIMLTALHIYVKPFKITWNMENRVKLKRTSLKQTALFLCLSKINNYLHHRNIMPCITSQLLHLKDKMIFNAFMEWSKHISRTIYQDLNSK